MPLPSKAQISAAAKVAYDLIRKEDEEIGYLSDFKAKWIMSFCRHLFGEGSVKISIDFSKKIKVLYMTPFVREGSVDTFFDVKTWKKLEKHLNLKDLERRLPDYIGLSGFVAKFSRTFPDGRKPISKARANKRTNDGTKRKG